MSDEEEQEEHQEDLVAPTFEEQIKFLRKARKAGTTRFQKTTEFNVARKLRKEGSDEFFDQKIVDDRLQEALNREAHRDFFQDSLGDAVLGKSSTSNHSLRSLFADDDMIVGKPKNYSEDEPATASAVRKVTHSSDDFYAPQAVRHEEPQYLADDDDRGAGPEQESDGDSENGFYHEQAINSSYDSAHELGSQQDGPFESSENPEPVAIKTIETASRVADFFASTQAVNDSRSASDNLALKAPLVGEPAVLNNISESVRPASNILGASGNLAETQPADAQPESPGSLNAVAANSDAPTSPLPKKGKATEYTIKLHRPLKIERKENAPALNSKAEAVEAPSHGPLTSPQLSQMPGTLAEAAGTSDIPPDMKECPRCAELIKKKAVYCRFCHLDLPADERAQVIPPVISASTLVAEVNLERDEPITGSDTKPEHDEPITSSDTRPEHDEPITGSDTKPEHDEPITGSNTKPEHDAPITSSAPESENQAAAVQEPAQNLEFEYFMPSVESTKSSADEDMSFSRNELDKTEDVVEHLPDVSSQPPQEVDSEPMAQPASIDGEQESTSDKEDREKRLRFSELISKFPLIAADFKFFTGFDLALDENSNLSLWLNACGDRMNLFTTELSDQGLQECFVFAQTLIEQYVHSLSNEFGLEFSRSNELVVRQLKYDDEGKLEPGETLQARFPRIDELKALHLAIECSWPATYQLADQFPLKVVFLTETLVRDEDVGVRIKFFEDGRPVLFISSTLASRGCPTDLDESIDGHESWQASLMREFAWKTAVDCNKFPLNPDEYESIGWVSVGDGFYALKTWDGRLYLPYGGAESPEQAWALCDENGEPIDLVGNPVSQPSDLVFISDAELAKVAAHKPCGDHFDTVEDYFVDGLKTFRQGAKSRAELGKINPVLYQMVKASDQLGINRCYSPTKTFAGMIRSSTGALVENNIANQKEVSKFESSFAVKK